MIRNDLLGVFFLNNDQNHNNYIEINISIPVLQVFVKIHWKLSEKQQNVLKYECR